MSLTNDPRALGRCCQILLVEDNARDVRLVREVMRERGLTCHLHVASNGQEALAMLRREAPYEDLPQPDIVLLDINLPLMSGIEVLTQIKADPRLRVVPVLMLTTSKADSDVLTCYALHANSYLVKPADFDAFTHMIGSIHDFWIKQNLPPSEAGSDRGPARRAGECPA